MRFFIFSSQKGRKSSERIRSYICDTLSKLGKQCEDIEFFLTKSCNEAVTTLASSQYFDVYIIAIGGENCYSNGVAEYCITRKNKKSFILLIEDRFSHVDRDKQLIFSPREKNFIYDIIVLVVSYLKEF